MNTLSIESIETIPLRVELKNQFSGSYYAMRNRCTIITRVITSDGIVGEAYNADTDGEQGEVLSIIHELIAPRVVQQDAMRTSACWEAMLPVSYDQLRDRRIVMQAMACVDTAIWDAVGKALGEPLHRLWGGYRSSVPMIGIGGYYYRDGSTDGIGIEDDVRFFVDNGFTGMKFKVGGGSPESDAERVKRAVASAPPDFVFVLDANQAYTYDEALALVRLLDGVVRPRWFEEPCRWYNDRRWMRDFRLATGIPVAAGQSEISANGVRELVESGSIDVCNFDASWGGGPTEWRRAAAIASLNGVVMGHHEEAQIASHLLASVPHGTYVEAFHPDRDPVFWELLANRKPLSDGHFELPTDPGLGWELDEGFIQRYRVS